MSSRSFSPLSSRQRAADRPSGADGRPYTPTVHDVGRECSSQTCKTRETEDNPFSSCLGCRDMWYCSKGCTRGHWPEHRGSCKKGRKAEKAWFEDQLSTPDVLNIEDNGGELQRDAMWTCPDCSTFNEKTARQCRACMVFRPKMAIPGDIKYHESKQMRKKMHASLDRHAEASSDHLVAASKQAKNRAPGDVLPSPVSGEGTSRGPLPPPSPLQAVIRHGAPRRRRVSRFVKISMPDMHIDEPPVSLPGIGGAVPTHGMRRIGKDGKEEEAEEPIPGRICSAKNPSHCLHVETNGGGFNGGAIVMHEVTLYKEENQKWVIVGGRICLAKNHKLAIVVDEDRPSNKSAITLGKITVDRSIEHSQEWSFEQRVTFAPNPRLCMTNHLGIAANGNSVYVHQVTNSQTRQRSQEWVFQREDGLQTSLGAAAVEGV